MKFVTVMDMWLLIMNIVMLGFVLYYGRNLTKTIARLLHVGEQREASPERRRIIAIIETELEGHRQMASMHSDRENEAIVHALEYLLDQVKKGK